MSRLVTSVFAAVLAGAAAAESFEANGCFAKWDGTTLAVGNTTFTRTYSAVGGRLRTVSFRLKGGGEWLRGKPAGAKGRLKVTCAAGRRNPAGIEGLVVHVSVDGKDEASTLRVFPGVSGVLKEEAWKKPLPEMPAAADAEDDAYRRICQQGWSLYRRAEAVGDALALAPTHLRVTSYTLFDQTDVRNNIVKKDEWLMPSCHIAEAVSATSLDVRDLATDDGLVFLRLAPMPISRPTDIPDFVVGSTAGGIVPLANGYPLAELAYAGGEAGRLRALQDLQRAIRPYRAGRDGVFLSNTWGDGNRDGRINAEFLMKEVEAAADIGVDVIQVDDGWQRGRTANTNKKLIPGAKKAWSSFREADPRFWEPDEERFPHGLAPLVEAAKAKGLVFGIWFGPDSSDELRHWEEDADCLLDFYRRFGIRYFKIDALRITTPLGFERNRKFFDKMLTESNADMVFDLDCTAGIRPGYFGLMDIGPLFVENRYARDNGRKYRPHQTLRNLWMLSQVVDPVRLRMEVLNPGKNQETYGEDPLAPSRWPADALFAITMAASPLGWMELSDVSSGTRAAWRPLIARWKKERAAMHGGTIIPVGDEPDGFAWTGFLSCAKDSSVGYAILFRELSDDGDFELDLNDYLPEGASFTNAEVIGGRGKAVIADDRKLKANVPAKLDFVWVKLSGEVKAPGSRKARMPAACGEVMYPAAGTLGGSAEKRLSFDTCHKFGAGFEREGAEIICDNGTDSTVQRGATWPIVLNQTEAIPFSITAESRMEKEGGRVSRDYSIYLDITYADGSKLYGQAAEFMPSASKGWQKKSVLVQPEKPVKSFSCHLLYRNQPGKVRFRAPVMRQYAGDKFTMYDTCNVILPKCRKLEKPSFLLRDVMACRGFESIEPDGEAGKIALEVNAEKRGGATLFDVTLKDLSGKDRAVTLVYAVPFAQGGKTIWHADPRTDIELGAGKSGQYRSVRDVGAGEGPLSIWPFGAMTTGGEGIALGIDCTAPAFFRTTANETLRQMFIAFDIGFTKEQPAAHFRFVRFGFPAKQGFRGALAEYQALLPEFSKVRIKEHGLWMAFARISKVEGWEDFGFKIKEGDNEPDWDDAHGILTFHYTEPCTWWMRMAGGAETYSLADCLVEADRLAASGDAFARAWRNSAMRDASGRVVGSVMDTPWCKGAVWNLCPLSKLPDGEYAYKFQDRDWELRYAGKTLPHGVDGEYIDSAEGYLTPPLDYARDHFAHCETPLAFDPITKEPAIAKCLSIFEYVRAAANRSHAIGRYLMGNCIPVRWPWLVAYSDYGGQEVRWIDGKTAQWKPMPDSELLYRRAMSGGKPYCFLMNVDFDKFPHELADKYMQRCLAYGLFANFFSPNASSGHYFRRPELYNRDRPLFKKYVPLCRRISEAGWRPVNTLAVSDNPAVFVEQFGDRYLTVFNPGDKPQTVRIRSLAGAKRAAELVAGGEWRFSGGVAAAEIPPETVRLLDFSADQRRLRK